ncbi:N-acetyl-alpha-D-glucosaminyl L-malate synthase BshA [Dethiobacter alkaliphilus]|uniref:Glycosyl transferase group 1 n=1 Tax=Dethiobacter alkaliphilus AHT 1 TaxID=555088 RepID=C0GG02_DETAL|nr:N-acetyl-alpha-D-glucosaminyl L-malate synthase BshA [Dethiobacter alkaliphilus]EEG77691.1 glycosyl transferase group 1 [Dethiobacter alkaliphilus AHT 1]
MKIGIICYPTHGGSGVVATELGKELAQRGHTVHFISYQLPFRLDRYQQNVYYHEVDMLGYPLFKYPPYTLALVNKIAELVEREGLDIIHAHYAIPHSFCAHMAREILEDCGVRVVTTLHGTDITLVGSDPSFNRITRYSIEKSDGVTAVSESLCAETVEKFGVTKPVRPIYNFINTRQVFRLPGSREQVGCPQADCKVLVHVSNFRPVKRVPDVVEVFARVRKEMNAKLLLVGDGVQRMEAQETAQRLQVQDDVRFMGTQDNIIPILSAADLFLLPSAKESFGLGALEAMACSVPVIASEAGGLPEVVVHGETGFLAPVGDVEALAGFALQALESEEKLQKMGEAARRRAEDVFDSERIVPQYEEFYREVLENRGKGC